MTPNFCTDCGVGLNDPKAIHKYGAWYCPACSHELDNTNDDVTAVDVLEALLRQTAHTQTQYDIELTACDSNQIPMEIVNEARDRVYER